jgi:hypothetical protein
MDAGANLMRFISFVSLIFCAVISTAIAAPGDARLSEEDLVVAGFTVEQRVNEIDSELFVLQPEYARLTAEIEKMETEKLDQNKQADLVQMKIDHGKIDAMISSLIDEKTALVKKGVTVSQEDALTE